MPKGVPITEERILQISNNVSEEFTDHGETDFANKDELCQVIKWWQKRCDEINNKHQQLIGNIAVTLAEATTRWNN